MRGAMCALLSAGLALVVAAPAPARDSTISGTASVGLAGLTLADLGHAVVYLEAQGALPETPGERPARKLRQHTARFEPSFLAVAVGQPIEMPNDDTIYHNVFSYSRPNDFDLGLYRAGESRTLRFDHAGPVRLYCSIHEGMNGLIFVAPNRWFAVPAANGAFVIADVPPGRYLLKLWSERAPEVQREIRVAAGVDARIELRVAAAKDR